MNSIVGKLYNAKSALFSIFQAFDAVDGKVLSTKLCMRTWFDYEYRYLIVYRRRGKRWQIRRKWKMNSYFLRINLSREKESQKVNRILTRVLTVQGFRSDPLSLWSMPICVSSKGVGHLAVSLALCTLIARLCWRHNAIIISSFGDTFWCESNIHILRFTCTLDGNQPVRLTPLVKAHHEGIKKDETAPAKNLFGWVFSHICKIKQSTKFNHWLHLQRRLLPLGRGVKMI